MLLAEYSWLLSAKWISGYTSHMNYITTPTLFPTQSPLSPPSCVPNLPIILTFSCPFCLWIIHPLPAAFVPFVHHYHHLPLYVCSCCLWTVACSFLIQSRSPLCCQLDSPQTVKFSPFIQQVFFQVGWVKFWFCFGLVFDGFSVQMFRLCVDVLLNLYNLFNVGFEWFG